MTQDMAKCKVCLLFSKIIQPQSLILFYFTFVDFKTVSVFLSLFEVVVYGLSFLGFWKMKNTLKLPLIEQNFEI